jgi:hypothetical protein
VEDISNQEDASKYESVEPDLQAFIIRVISGDESDHHVGIVCDRESQKVYPEVLPVTTAIDMAQSSP